MPADGVQLSGLLDDGMSRLLLAIDEAAEPVGSRQLSRRLSRDGVRWSEATMARRLRALDDLGLTIKTGTKGRMLTHDGQRRVSSLRRGRVSAQRLLDASTIRTADDVMNLLRARRAIEPEGIRGATESATDMDFVRLSELLERHRAATRDNAGIPRELAMGFHRTAALCSPNPILRAILQTVLGDDTDPVEAALDVVLMVRRRTAESVPEHEAIVAAMKARDAELAAELMRTHLDRLIHEVEAFTRENDPVLLESMLALTRPAPRG